MRLADREHSKPGSLHAPAFFRFFQMAMRLGLLAAFFFAVYDASAWAGGRAGIYYDGSGSMKGFFAAGSILNINQKLYEAFSSFHVTPASQVFVSQQNDTRLYTIDAFNANPVWGTQTLLDQAFSKTTQDDLVVLVTDNVQDAGEQSTTSTRDFYRALESKEIQAVLLCPLLAQFNGPVYFYKQQFPDKPQLAAKLREENPQGNFTDSGTGSQLYHVLNMNGPRALALYFIVKSSFAMENIPRLIVNLENALGAKPILMVKPVDQGRLLLESVLSKKDVRDSFEGMVRLCPEHSKGKIEIHKPNLQLSPPSSTIFMPAQTADEKRYLLKRAAPISFRTDQEMSFRFYFRITNQSDTVVLGKLDEKCSRKVSVDFKDLHYTIPSPFVNCFLNPLAQSKGELIPGSVPGVIEKEKAGSSDGQVPFVASAAIRIPPPVFDATLKNILILALKGDVPIGISGTVRITVPPGYFSLETAYKHRYFTDSLYDQTRIYSPEDIVSYINLEPTELAFEFVSRGLMIEPPPWIRHALYAFLAILFLVLIYILLNFSMRYYLKINDTGESMSVFLPVPFSKCVYLKNEEEMLICKKGALGYRIFPGEAFRMEDSNGRVIRCVKPCLGRWFRVVKQDTAIIIACISASAHTNSTLKTRLNSGVRRRKKSESAPGTSSGKNGAPLRQGSKKSEFDQLFGKEE